MKKLERLLQINELAKAKLESIKLLNEEIEDLRKEATKISEQRRLPRLVNN